MVMLAQVLEDSLAKQMGTRGVECRSAEGELSQGFGEWVEEESNRLCRGRGVAWSEDWSILRCKTLSLSVWLENVWIKDDDHLAESNQAQIEYSLRIDQEKFFLPFLTGQLFLLLSRS